MTTPARALLSLLLLAGLGASGCTQSGTPAELAPDFLLVDSNPNSTSFGESVSPRSHLGHVSVWYFGKAT